MSILLKIIVAHIHYRIEGEQKDQHPRDENYRRNLRKVKTEIFKKYSEAIKTVSSLNPDPSRFDEAYLLDRAKKNTDGAFAALSKPIRKKGFISVRLFIRNTYSTIRESQSPLKDNAICSRLADRKSVV